MSNTTTSSDLFSNAELKSIAIQALGGATQGKPDVYIQKSEEIIDAKVEEKIKQKSKDLTDGITNVANKATDITSNTNLPVSIPGGGNTSIPNTSNIMSSLQGHTSVPSASGALNGLKGNIPSLPSVPSVPISLDPASYIPDPQIPFKALVKPLLDKAISKALGKFNPSSLVQKAEGSVGKLQSKATSSLQSIQSKTQEKLEKTSEDMESQVKNSIKDSSKQVSDLAKQISREVPVIKRNIASYIRLFLLRNTDPLAFARDPDVQKFKEIDSAK